MQGLGAGARRSLVYGVDFSGARDAGRRLWWARGRLRGEALVLEACAPGAALPGSGIARDACLAALRGLARRERGAVVGLDFPFGLPWPLARRHATWEEFVAWFAEAWVSAEAFRAACLRAAGGRELRRATDREARTPWCPYNLRLHRQTFHGLRDVLAPLVRDGAACALPMQPAEPGKAWLVEVCPASLLRREARERGLALGPHKGPGRERARRRGAILEHALRRGGLRVPQAGLREALVRDEGGDALDAALAALAAARALRDGFRAPRAPGPERLEGWVYA